MSTGRYLYLEASSPRSPGEKAVFESGWYQKPAQSCSFRFWYHMFGAGIGALNIYTVDQSNKSSKIWTQTGAKSSNWELATATVAATGIFKVREKRKKKRKKCKKKVFISEVEIKIECLCFCHEEVSAERLERSIIKRFFFFWGGGGIIMKHCNVGGQLPATGQESKLHHAFTMISCQSVLREKTTT